MKRLLILFMCAMLFLLGAFTLFSCEEEENGTNEEKTNSSEVEEFTLTFVHADGYGSELRRVKQGEALTDIPEVRKITGYDVKWEVDDFSSIQQSMIINAIKTPTQYKITYELNDGINHFENVEAYTIESELEFKAPIKKNYEFLGWYSDSEFTTSVSEISKGSTGDIILYAKWEKMPSVTVTFDTNGGNAMDSIKVIKGADLGSHKPTKKGYTFVGWYLDGELFDETDDVEKDITLKAEWTLTNYQITYEDEHNAPNSNPISYTILSEITLKPLSKAGYTFDGWYDGEIKITKISQGTVGAITLVAKWLPKASSKTEIREDWSGKTLNVLVTRYGQTATYPWGQVELCADTFGESIGAAFDERQAHIKELYGVDVHWVPAISNQSIASELASAELSGAATFELAIPRMQEIQSLVSEVYDLGNSKYYDITNSYYSQASYEAFTVAGHTLFTTGDFDFFDEQSSSVLFFNKDMFAKISNANIYDVIKEGAWTYDALTSISTLATKDTANDGYGDEDMYGLGVKDFTLYYHYFGVLDTDVDQSTGKYRFAFDLDIDKTEVVISLVKSAKSATWTHYGWGGYYGSAMNDAFTEGRLLFANDTMQKFQELFYNIDFSVGIVPFPKLNTEQENYCVPTVAAYTTVMCIPKVTQDREMSEYFLDVLSWTGSEYTVRAYYDVIECYFDPETSSDDMEIIKTYIFGNIKYDIGEVIADGSLSTVKFRIEQNESLSDVLSDEKGFICDTIDAWNRAWEEYTES